MKRYEDLQRKARPGGTRPDSNNLKIFESNLRFQFPFPLTHGYGSHGVADDVGGGAAHVQEGIDTEEEDNAFFGDSEQGQGAGNDNQGGAGYAGDAFAGDHEG